MDTYSRFDRVLNDNDYKPFRSLEDVYRKLCKVEAIWIDYKICFSIIVLFLSIKYKNIVW